MKKRPLGQNFLIDESVADEIVEIARIDEDDHVVEIGPGKGVLTRRLTDRAARVTAIEIDGKLIGPLKNEMSEATNFTLLNEDALKFDFGSIKGPYKVVSNLPYYAAAHILKRLIVFRKNIQDMTLMLQKEVVDRFSAQPGSRCYGSLTVFLQYHCTVERLLEVGRLAFSPPPKIESSVVRLTPLAKPKIDTVDEKLFFKIVSAAFFHKRKMLKNNLQIWDRQFRNEQGSLQLAGIDLSRRAETLTLQDFADLSNHIHQHQNNEPS
ncbi:MAG: 16S rRNA (adenine(1518)-N(6)/adenine(1519)-N(6))-dimethyltransferase RsmA [Candidatus Nitrohelix vancouverensis]|uniref:Ribosomal RNA small subunit methyltransferase A n=1 Tax=Candidatus Nitrohelix vancouverensis TaxID=2705534 RepID=A0A7T0C1V1_9BACT|nr:MAG: 16S rRNA (adenine(1518)-N(6)/adenine(1519)-N(6))-dimethyltransferase RsmA [Candidatus Nitrohelix vancouverensis]